MKKFGVVLLMLLLGICVLLILDWNASADETENPPGSENEDLLIAPGVADPYMDDYELQEEYGDLMVAESTGEPDILGESFDSEEKDDIGDPILVASTVPGTQSGRHLVRNSDGYWFVIYSNSSSANNYILLAVSSDTVPTSFDPPINLVRDGTGIISSSHNGKDDTIEIDHKDVIHVAYISYEVPLGLYYARCDTSTGFDDAADWTHADGVTTGSELLATSDGEMEDPEIAVHYNGDISIAWAQSNAAGVRDIYYRQLNGNEWGPEEHVNEDNVYKAQQAKMHVDLDDNVHLIWRERLGGGARLKYIVRRADSVDWRNCMDTNSSPDVMAGAHSHDVIVDKNGSVLSTYKWTELVYDICVFGTGWTGAKRVNNDPDHDSIPSLGFASDGSIYAVVQTLHGFPNIDVRYTQWNGSNWSALVDVDTTGAHRSISTERYGRFDSIGFVYVDYEASKLYFNKIDVANPMKAKPVTIQMDETDITQGDEVEFQVNWTHEHSLIAYRFGWDDSGSWVNDSWVNSEFWGKNRWSNITKTVTARIGSKIKWRVWAQDIHYNINDTGLQSFILGGNLGGTGNYPSPEYGDWIIKNETHVWNDTIVLNGNLSIEDGGSLTFDNVLLKMNCSEDGEYGITVNYGGKFYIYDYDNNPETKYDRSNITAMDTQYEFKFLVDSGSEFEMRNSELSECGYDSGITGRAGLTIKTNNAVIENSSFFDNYHGIYFDYSNDNKIINNNISNIRSGIYLMRLCNNNQIINNNVSKNNLYGIFIGSSCNNNQIINNHVYSNGESGIFIINSENNQIINNTLYNNQDGIVLKSSSDIKMRDNIMNNNKYNFNVWGGYNDIDTSNTINGKPIYYIQNQNNLTFDNSMNIGYLGLISCSNVTIKNLSLNNNGQGILFVSTKDSLIENCEIRNNSNGIYFSDSNNNKITNNNVSNNGGGISLRSSSNNNPIINNNVSNNGNGILVHLSNDNQITNNSISNNSDGIYLFRSVNNQIINNSIYYNNQGIYIWDSDKSQIINSTITNSTAYDFYFDNFDGSDSEITAINTTFNKDKVYFVHLGSELTVKWYLHVNVIDGDYIPIPNTRVIVENLEGVEIYNETTGLDGWVKWIICTEYKQNQSSRIPYTEHTIKVEKDDIQINRTIKMDENKFIILKQDWYKFILACEESEKSTNPGESVFFQIKITNIGIKSNKISLEVINPTKWLAYLNSYHTFLSPSEERIVILTVEPPKDELEGISSTIYVKGTSEGDTTIQDSVKIETIVNFDHSIEIIQNLLEGNIDPGKSIKYEIQLKNLGNGNERIYLRKNSSQSDEQGNWIIYNDTELLPLKIDFRKSGTTFIKVTSPSNTAANEQKKLVFDIFSEDIFLGSFTTITTVNQTHNVEIECEEIEKNGKPSETITYVLNLTNYGNGEETLLLELSGENIDWCDLSETYISLNSNKYTEVYLDVLIPNNAKVWEKAEIIINVLSLDRTEKYSSINILTNVLQLYDLKIEIEEKEFFVEPGKEFEFDVTIENLGNGIDDITLFISGIPTNWEIDPSTINPLIDSESSFTNSFKLTIPENALASEIATLVFEAKSNKFGDFVLDNMNLTVYVNQNYEIELKCNNPEKEVSIGELIEYKIEHAVAKTKCKINNKIMRNEILIPEITSLVGT